ncbi:MAG: hypothetical protein LBV60_06395 [Streptomyces sp.]|nr:hypothetical protein [Streptomyces sp.]
MVWFQSWKERMGLAWCAVADAGGEAAHDSGYGTAPARTSAAPGPVLGRPWCHRSRTKGR